MADAIISIVVDQLSIIIKDQIQDVRAALGVEKEIKNLSSKLNKIRAVLNDAERRSFKEESVKLWLEEIQNLCYDVEDVVDEWSTKTRRQQRERSSSEVAAAPAAGSSSSFLPCCFHFKKIVMHRDIANKIKELDSRLDRIAREKDQFKFDHAASVAHTHISGQESKRVTTTSFVDASEIQGRESDASALISKLVENNNNNGSPVVISIVGAGGIGKTTLAQLVYGHQQIKAHFDQRVWVCVSQPFDQIKIAKDIVHSISSENLSEPSLQVLLDKIHSTLSQKRFLLVLDDVWTEDYAKWEPFNNCLRDLGKNCPGSRILVTSRKNNVARMMGIVYQHPVELISDTDAWSLLSRTAFSGRSSSNSREEEAYSVKFKDIGQKIAQKCKGLPLAVKVMGSLLRSKDTEEEWQTVLSQLDTKFSNVEGVETHLFPHLYLSYHDLTPQMKRCFSYCAIFPKDYRIYVDDLIRIWMAQGYLTTTNGTVHNQIEQKGREVFGNLAMRSLFQDFKKHYMDSKIIISCKMHDIVHDFAKFLTKNECYSVEYWQEDKVKIENLRHLSWQKTGRPMNLASICDDVLGKLHSFFAEDLSPEQLTPNMFNGLKSVRVLGLHACMLSKLPKEIGNLIHLRYIDLRRSEVDELPDSICSLDNLQTLNLAKCKCLSRLPKGIGNLRHLRKIDVSGSKVDELPYSICSLDNLQTLNLSQCKFLSRLPEGIGYLHQLRLIDLSMSKVEELPDSICSLNNLPTLNLEGCVCLSRLPERIGNLHQLRSINLSMSKVEELPDSICSLDNLQILNLNGCKCLSRLPEGIGYLHQLRYIDLRWTKVEKLLDSICYLDNLQTLDLSGCQCLSRLPERIGNLRHLHKIDLSWSTIEELPDSICSLDHLQTLNLKGCISRLPKGIGNLHHLREIVLSWNKIEELPHSICSLDNLQTLILQSCKCLSKLPEGIGYLHQLREIDLSRCKVEELPDSICSLDNLEILNLDGCECLSRLPEGIGYLHQLRSINLSRSKIEMLPDSICSLHNLQILNLNGCKCLSRLPEGIGYLHQLRVLNLSGSKVEELPDSICSLDNLDTLILNQCKCLSGGPEGIENFHSLTLIDLSGSKLEELPDSFCSLDNLRTLSLVGCECVSRLPQRI